MISQRKADHLKICLKNKVEEGNPGFDDITLVHNSLSELDFDEIDTEIELFGKKLSMPLIISAVTGGVAEAKKINRDLASVAEKKKIGFGLGSQRALIEDSKLLDTYYVRDIAHHTLIFGNIGIAQVKKYSVKQIEHAIDSVGTDALCVHTNPAQEIFQTEGDVNLKGCLKALGNLCNELISPVVVKEVGNGLSRDNAVLLKQAGVKAIDVGGHGGTNWVVVDGIRAGKDVSLFRTWGIPTAISVLETKVCGLPIIATGGVRSGLDIAKSIALGATSAGIALPFLKVLNKSGRRGVIDYIEKLEHELKTTMFLTGSRTIKDLKNAKYVLNGRVKEWVDQRGL